MSVMAMKDSSVISKLREARLAKDLSQEALAALAGTSQPQIDRLEKGVRTLTTTWANKLAPHLGIDPAELAPPVSGANRIRELRKAKNLTQEELGVRAGTDKSQIRRLENGERRLTLDWMRRLAGALQVEVDDLHGSGSAESDSAIEYMRTALETIIADLDHASDACRKMVGLLKNNKNGAETLGQRLRRLREEAGISSQEKAAQIFGVSRAAVSQWESDETKPELGRLSAIAAAYFVNLSALLDGLAADDEAAETRSLPSLDPEGIRDWIKDNCAKHDVSPSGWARKANLDPGTVTRFLNDPDVKHRLSATTIEKLQAVISEFGAAE